MIYFMYIFIYLCSNEKNDKMCVSKLFFRLKQTSNGGVHKNFIILPTTLPLLYIDANSIFSYVGMKGR